MMPKEYKQLIKLQRFPMEQIYLKCVRVRCYQKLSGTDEDIDNTKTEDIDNTKTEDIYNTDNIETEDNGISKTAYFDNTKTDDIDNTKTVL